MWRNVGDLPNMVLRTLQSEPRLRRSPRTFPGGSCFPRLWIDGPMLAFPFSRPEETLKRMENQLLENPSLGFFWKGGWRTSMFGGMAMALNCSKHMTTRHKSLGCASCCHGPESIYSGFSINERGSWCFPPFRKASDRL